ncbi:protein FAM117B [Gallus gallus]|uniref:protein FAM117B n=1 Tax=Gallus gallus TaxID=9031 RepID=UPI001AE600B7|nr:protein FAM117B [Gallus gallus]XP_040513914.1 protein FAM117B [Gallus gallus]
MSLVGSGGGAAGGGSAGHRGGGSVPERGGGVVAEVNESRGKGAVATRERRCRLLTRRGARPGSVRTHRSASPFPSERPAERRAFAHGSPTPPPLSAVLVTMEGTVLCLEPKGPNLRTSSTTPLPSWRLLSVQTMSPRLSPEKGRKQFVR